MKRLKVINKNMSPKTKSRIRGWLTFITIIVVVVLFVALVVGLSLGLKDDPGCGAGKTRCKGSCKHLQTDESNCGKCGHKCPSGAECVDGQCAFCTVNCTLDDNMCTIDPCNETSGCSTLDCENDGDMCSFGTCNPDTGCQVVNCTNDDDVCTIAPCNPETGCAQLDCNGDNDPCTTFPCNPVLGCAFICSTLTLSPPSVNFTATYADFSTARAIVGSGLTIGSLTNIQSVAVTISPSGSGGTFAVTEQGGITGNYAGDVYTLSGNAAPSVWQNVLRTLTYQNPTFAGSSATFTFSVTNLSITSPNTPVATINV